jgi:hypothetical protein
MATGDAALLDGMDIIDSTITDANTLGDEENKTRDYIAGRARKEHTHARADITDLPAIAGANSAEPGEIPIYNDGGQLTSFPPTLGAHVATKAYVDGKTPPAQLTDGGTFLRADGKNLGTTGDLFASGTAILSGTVPVTTNYVALYLNGDGRVGKTPSARRFKKDIRDHGYSIEDLLSIRVRDYRLRAALYGSADAPVEVGVIAEELVDAGLSEFVYFDEDGEPASVHYERLALVAIGALQDLAVRFDDLAGRVDALEGR